MSTHQKPAKIRAVGEKDGHFFPRLSERMFIRLMSLPPICFPVYLALCRLYLTSKGNPITLSNVRLSDWGIRRRTKYRALIALESAGIIAVERRPRKNPLVTLREIP